MRYNNKHILECISEGKKLAEELLNYMDDEIKSNSY